MRISVIRTGRRLSSLLATPTFATSSTSNKWLSTNEPKREKEKIAEVFELDGRKFETDGLYNVSPAVRRLLDRRILKEDGNPLNLLKRRITDYVHQTYRKAGNRSPLFTICESEPRVVTTFQNFDSLLTPNDHVSR
ncbi:unnamed protein product [Caenorhabditis sp. 36 PRJEB53466]|nr:unnamed protein product [Caenorhabditis sp. 36 PRJEB53466]